MKAEENEEINRLYGIVKNNILSSNKVHFTLSILRK